MTFLLLLSSLASAGKLADGWRGIPYGPATVLAAAPTANCVPAPEAGVAWQCHETVADVEVTVSYMVDEGLYDSAMIQAKGYTACKTVFDTISAAWKPVVFEPKKYTRGVLPDGYWNLLRLDGGTSASWGYNDYSGECVVVTMNRTIYDQAEAIKARRAAKAAEAL